MGVQNQRMLAKVSQYGSVDATFSVAQEYRDTEEKVYIPGAASSAAERSEVAPVVSAPNWLQVNMW